MGPFARANTGRDRPRVIVIGCDEVGSAIACTLHAAGMAIVLVDDVDPPWARRGMSYADAWYVGGATLEQVDACFCGSVKSIPAVLARGDTIAATTWSWDGVASALGPVAVVETRPGCGHSLAHARPERLEGVLAVGVRTSQVAGWRADVVIAGAARGESGLRAAPLAFASRGPWGQAPTRIEAPHHGRFHTRHEIAERVEAGDVIGELGNFAAVAPASGVLTALAARGARVAAGHTLAEIDPSGDAQRCYRMTSEARAIAGRVASAVRAHVQSRGGAAANPDTLKGFSRCGLRPPGECPSTTCRRS